MLYYNVNFPSQEKKKWNFFLSRTWPWVPNFCPNQISIVCASLDNHCHPWLIVLLRIPHRHNIVTVCLWVDWLCCDSQQVPCLWWTVNWKRQPEIVGSGHPTTWGEISCRIWHKDNLWFLCLVIFKRHSGFSPLFSASGSTNESSCVEICVGLL